MTRQINRTQTIVHNILTKTAADSGHMDLTDAGYIQVQMSGPIPIIQTVKAGALFVFRGGLERVLLKSPQLQGIGYTPNSTGYVFINLRFNPVPVLMLEKLVVASDIHEPVFLILKMLEKKDNEMLIGPPREWNAGYAIEGIVGISGGEIVLAGRAGKPIRS